MAENTKSAPTWGPTRSGTPGGATQFDAYDEANQTGTYKTSGLVYPSDLLTNKTYGGNYVIFYLNIHQDSKVVSKEDEAKSIVPEKQVPRRESGNVASTELSAATYGVLGAGAGAIAANSVNAAGKVSGAIGTPLNAAGEKVVNTVGGAALGGAAAAILGGAKKYKRMNKAIALHIPTDLSIKYGMDWHEENMAGSIAIASSMEAMGPALLAAGAAGGLAGALLKSKKAGLIAGAATGTIVGALTGGLGTATKTLGAYGAGLAAQTPGVGQFLAKAAGVAANPKKEQLFRSVDFRTFSFSYQFFPRSSDEAKNVLSIIKEFKFHMHPEFKDAAQFLYIVPSEFDIFYYQNGTENMALHRHTSCVLVDMNISYTPQGVFATFDDGMPTQINVQMTFKELATLSKETIADGF